MQNDKINQALEDLSLALTESGTLEANSSISFKDNIHGKGIFWAGDSYTKQFVYTGDPDRLFSTENIDIADNKAYHINSISVLSAQELGRTVTKSSLREVGRLRGLIVDGSLSVNQFLYFDGDSDRLGIGTEEPNAALSVAEDDVEVMIGTTDSSKGYIGTFASNDFEIHTDNTMRISVSAGGDIKLGNPNSTPVKVNINGKLSIGVNNADPEVDLHVKGSVKFNNKLQAYGSEPPRGGNYNIGDIIWNENPRIKSYVGWVCTKSGNPGIWSPFGEIR